MSFYHWRNFPEKNPVLLWDRVPLWRDGTDQDPPSLTPYPAEKARGAVIVCPGGGYAFKASHEAEDYAVMLQKAGISAYVLNYRVAPFLYPAPLLDLRRAVRWVRAHAEAYGLPAGAPVAVMGSSAGGHLAALGSTLFGEDLEDSKDPVDGENCRPDAAVLCYPVITLEEPFTHTGSRDNLLGIGADPERIRKLSCENTVTPETPPVFLWHTVADAGVPVENSLRFAEALRKNGVSFEMHLFPEGPHGLGLAPELPEVAVWAGLAVTFLKKNGC